MLKLDKRAWKAGAGSIEKEPHAQGLSALHGDQAHLPADVIAIHEIRNKSFITLSVSFQPRDALFNRTLKPGADFVAFSGGEVGDHGGLLGDWHGPGKIFSKHPKVFPLAADINEDQ
jgi:hypothetical protein